MIGVGGGARAIMAFSSTAAESGRSGGQCPRWTGAGEHIRSAAVLTGFTNRDS